MKNRETEHSKPAPATISHGAAELIFMPRIEPSNVGIIPGDAASQVRQVLSNLEVALESSNLSWRNVVKVLVYVTSPEVATYWQREVTLKFGDEWCPAITVVQISNLVTPEAMLELDITAASSCTQAQVTGAN